MYLTGLVRIFKKIPSITEKNFAALDNFFGDVGSGGIFTSDELRRSMTQKQLTDKVLLFLVEEGFVVPLLQRCPRCGHDAPFPTEICELCGNTMDPKQEIHSWKVVASLEMSDEDKLLRRERNSRLQISAFRLLLKKIQKKRDNNESGTLLFFDLANSTNASHFDKHLVASIKKRFREFLSVENRNWFLRSKSILIKSDGDSSYLFFISPDDAKRFLIDVRRTIHDEPWMRQLTDFNEGRTASDALYFKAYEASSEVLEVHQKDVLSLDFDDMEAFVFINRIEKAVKEKAVEDYNLESLFPFFLASRDPLFSDRTLRLTDVINYGSQEVFFTLPSEIPEEPDL